MAKNLLRKVMAASFRRVETTDGKVTKRPILVHEANTPSSGEPRTDDFRQLCQGGHPDRVTNVSIGTELDAATESDEITSLHGHAPHRRLPYSTEDRRVQRMCVVVAPDKGK
jgi:hypothetical protein